jgi:4-carboxymuconolactone decarboxylase
MPGSNGATDAGVEAGLAVYAKLRGAHRAAGMRDTINAGAIGSDMTTLSMDFVFGRVWARGVLDPKQRSLVTIGLLIALRQTAELKNHINLGLTNGLTAQEIEEATIQAAAYAGFPAARVAADALAEVIRDHPELVRSEGQSR